MTAAIALFLWACGNKTESASREQGATTTAKDSSKTESDYFPVYDFLRNEVEYVDSLPVGIKKFTSSGSKRDSGYIKLEEFHTLAGEFLVPELYDSAFKKLFKESSFLDRSSNNATFFYKTDDESSPVKRIDVVTQKGNVYDEVRSIYIEKHSDTGDSSLVKRMYWRPKRNFQITTVTSVGKGKPRDEQIIVVWDNSE